MYILCVSTSVFQLLKYKRSWFIWFKMLIKYFSFTLYNCSFCLPFYEREYFKYSICKNVLLFTRWDIPNRWIFNLLVYACLHYWLVLFLFLQCNPHCIMDMQCCRMRLFFSTFCNSCLHSLSIPSSLQDLLIYSFLVIFSKCIEWGIGKDSHKCFRYWNKSKEGLTKFHKLINNIYELIQFTMGMDENELLFLYILMIKENQTVTSDFYCKHKLIFRF